MIHPGKIARLPREIREELNRRLADAESGGSLLRWLNDLPVMRAISAREFGGRPVSKQNLCKWRASGFAQWEARRELLEQQRALAANVPKPPAATDGKWTDHLATLLAVRYAAALAPWNGQADVPFGGNLRTLRALCQDVVQLRRGDHNVVRFKLEQDRREFEQEKTREVPADHFKHWTQNSPACAVHCQECVPPEDLPPSSPASEPDWAGQPRSTQVNPGQP
jgi:hypothetical protein